MQICQILLNFKKKNKINILPINIVSKITKNIVDVMNPENILMSFEEIIVIKVIYLLEIIIN